MIKIGITGQSGFVGTHLAERLRLLSGRFELVPFEDEYFQDIDKLRNFVKQCDVIVHLAAMMRSPHVGEVYATNMSLVKSLILAIDTENVMPNLFFASSIQETNGTEYARCKIDGKRMLSEWAINHGRGFGCMIFPNLFGPNAKPNSHSFIATFCYRLTHNEQPVIINDNIVSLKYIDSVLDELIPFIEEITETREIKQLRFIADYQVRVSDVLSILKSFDYHDKNGIPPQINNQLERDLFNTYLSYKNL